jgi:hypothetical protein
MPRRNPLQQLQALRERLAGIAAVAGQARDGVHGIGEMLGAQAGELAALRTQLAALEQQLAEQRTQAAERDAVLRRMLRAIFNEERRLRELLWQVRAEPSYELAYSESEPLVSVVIATYDNFELLGERSLPSVLAQTYANFEVVVVGDQAPEEAAEIVAGFGDDRLTFHNLNRRGPYPSDPEAFWHVAGIPPYNEAVRRARGRWIAPLGDDDAFRPHHIEALLGLARAGRHEATYGRFLAHFADHPPVDVGAFPPQYGQFGVQVLLYHAGLSFFEMELADELFSLPGDWSLAERMLRCGVRFGMLDDVVTDYYPSRSWTPRTP